MKNFCFALPGMVVLLCLLGSCSNTDIESVKQELIEAIEELQDDEAAAFEGTPVTKNGEEAPAAGKKPDASSPDAGAGNPPTDGTPNSGTPAGNPPDSNPPTDGSPAGGTPANVPSLRINELRASYTTPYIRADYIEFKILSAGNLGGLRVFIASNNNPLVYEFSSVEVNIGEYVTLHLGTLEASCRNEYGENLNESGGSDSSPKARDFWIPGNAQLLRRTDAVYIMDQGNRVLDAVMIAENPDSVWPNGSGNDWFSETGKFLLNESAWKSDAVKFSGIKSGSISKSVSRDETAEDTNTEADWYVTITTVGMSPGDKNKP